MIHIFRINQFTTSTSPFILSILSSEFSKLIIVFLNNLKIFWIVVKSAKSKNDAFEWIWLYEHLPQRDFVPCVFMCLPFNRYAYRMITKILSCSWQKTFIYCALLIICDVNVTQRDYNTHANKIVIETSFTMRTTQQIYYLPSYVVQNPMNLIMCMHLGSIISTGGFVVSNK